MQEVAEDVLRRIYITFPRLVQEYPLNVIKANISIKNTVKPRKQAHKLMFLKAFSGLICGMRGHGEGYFLGIFVWLKTR